MSQGAVILLSGGLDSSVLAYFCKKERFDLTALTFQLCPPRSNLIELKCARQISRELGIRHLVIYFSFVNSLLGNFNDDKEAAERKDVMIPLGMEMTHLAGAIFASSMGIERLFCGVQYEDISRDKELAVKSMRSYFEIFTRFINLRNKARLIIDAPFLKFTKREIVETGIKLGVPFEKTFSCLVNRTKFIHCGKCEQRVKRREAFNNLGIIL